MALVLADRVRETTTTTGTGSVTLAGAYTGFQTFSSAIGNGNSTYYTIANVGSGEWEVGIGSYASGGNLLSRTTVLASSNGGSLVNFGAGVKDAFVTQPAERALYIASAGTGLESKVTAFTNGGIVYASSTSALVTGSALVFDGSQLGIVSASGNYPGKFTGASGTAGYLYSDGNGFGVTDNGVNNGIYIRPAINSTIFYAGNAEGFRLTSTSLYTASTINVGIGTSSPTAKLTVSGNQSFVEKTAAYLGVDVATSAGNGGNLTVKAGAGNGAGNTAGTLYLGAGRGNASASNGSIVFGIAQATNTVGLDSTLMTLDASGNLGIGETSPTAKLHIGVASAAVNGTKGVRITNPAGTIVMLECGSGGDSFVGTTSGSDFNIRTNNVTRATFDNSGNLLVGTTGLGTIGSSSGSTITASGAIYSASTGESIFSRRSSDGDVILFRRDTTGVGSIAVTTVLTTYNTTSDYRLKNITGALTGAKDFIMALQPKQGTWKADGSKFVGFLAHEFQEVSPSSVSGVKDAVDEDGKPIMQSMQASSSEVIANMVSLLQEQQALIQTLTARITALEGA